jgi:hypothetical protein
MSLTAFTEIIRVERETMAKWRRNGWLETINIYGRHYVTDEEQRRFKQRAMAGEFAQTIQRPPSRQKTREDGARDNGPEVADLMADEHFKELQHP